MGLSDGKVSAAIAVSDMDRAVEFYEGKLGLTPSGGEEVDGGRTYACGGGSSVHVFPSPAAHGTGATVAGWQVDDVEGTIGDLLARGVTPEHYDDGPIATDEKGVARIGDFVGAWVKDPDGNVLSIGNG
ncbi:VOC family protein [Nocardioides coralli]|uniref:VOC family protein n=1 Tax=Nocardioides coralli TaxID=2872154 RepID=UPI001CA3FD98|nr:VOC family protein [Nocardioides coralli]QZY30173.1 VOC family protein [Nocardioides coralli]